MLLLEFWSIMIYRTFKKNPWEVFAGVLKLYDHDLQNLLKESLRSFCCSFEVISSWFAEPFKIIPENFVSGVFKLYHHDLQNLLKESLRILLL